MLYMLLGNDAPNSLETRLSCRPAHVERLKALQAAGRLVLAGPCPLIDAADPGAAGFSGSLVVAQFDSLELAVAWMKDDPYVTNGVWSSYDVRPFKQVLP